MKNDLVRLMYRSFLSPAGWLFLSFFLCCFFSFHLCFAEEIEKIQYVSEHNNQVSGLLVPDPSPGMVPVTNNPLIDFLIDDSLSQFSLFPSAHGTATFSSAIGAIAEGRHTALLKSAKPDGGYKDSNQVLFIYDVTPPNLSLISPESGEISKNVLSFLVEFSDEGSGIASQLEEIDVSATINGVPATIETVAHDDKRYFLINYQGKTGVQGGRDYQLSLALKDRAGNEATLEEHFKTKEDYQETITEQKTCLSPANESFSFETTIRQDFSFPITNRLSPILFSSKKRSDSVEIAITTEEKLDPAILQAVTITTDHPALALKPLPGSPRYPVRYAVEQKNSVSSLDGRASLKVEFPSVLSAEYEWECSDDGKEMEPSLDDITASAERDSFMIPVILYWKNSRQFETKSVQDPDGSNYLEYSTWTEPGSSFLDSAASSLIFQDSSYFFDNVENRFVSRAPVEKEGYYKFQVALASAAGTWTHNNSSFGQEEHETLFDLGPPQITSFQYNSEDQQLEALFSDRGTPVEDLQISVTIDGFGKRKFRVEQLEDGTTRLVSPFPLPPSIIDAQLSITDLAQNSAEKACRIFGIPPEKPDDGTAMVSDYALQKKLPDDDDSAAAKGYQVLSSLSGGLSVVRQCPVEQIIAVSDYYIKDRERLTSRKHTSYYPYRSYKYNAGRSGALLHSSSTEFQAPVVEIINPATGEYEKVAASSIAKKDRTYQVYSFELCENSIKDVRAPEIKNITFNPQDNRLSATISDHGRPASQVYTSLTVGVSVPRRFNAPTLVDHEYTPEQEPVISVSQGLSAPGMPNYSIKKRILESLTVYSVDNRFQRVTSGRSNEAGTSAEPADLLQAVDPFMAYKKSQENSKRSFENGHGLSGAFRATLPVPPLVIGEKYELTISARDQAGNSSEETILLTIPRSPPVVGLELVNTDSVASFTVTGSAQRSVHLRATAVDESGLDLERTYLDLDSVRLAPLNTFGTGGLGTPPRNPNAYSFNEILEDSYKGTWLDQYVAHYSALLEEGTHSARFQATDIMGLTADQQLDFTVAYLPEITQFAAKPMAIQDLGGPAFTARIIDNGKDLEPGGIRFLIDGVEVDRDRLYFDPASGYFAVHGPLGYGSGYHSARIVAEDNHGHRTTETIRFVAGEEIIAAGDLAELGLETITIWELENKNNDGQANPGELIRIFPTLFNAGSLPLEECVGTLFAEDNRMVVETTQSRIGRIDPARSATMLRGFDVQIGDDILDATISDPYDTHFRLDVACSDGTWEMGFVLPVYRPSLPVDINSQVTIALEPQARTNTSAETTLRGTVVSSSSFVESVSVRVNGQIIDDVYLDRATGQFEARVPLEAGSNSIEIEAADRSGAVGYKTSFINCRSSVVVTLDRLPHSSTAAKLDLSGHVESSASLIERVRLTVNGGEQPIRWLARQNRFEASIVLEQGGNTIVVEAWDEAGSYGSVSEMISFGSTMSVVLDRLPPATSEATITVAGTVQASSAIDRVTLLVNGSAQTADYNPSTRRFSAQVSLAVGGNSISAEAFSSNGQTASDRAYVTRTELFDPASITIVSPGGGTTVICDPIVISGTFDPGSSAVEQISVSIDPSYLDCSPVAIGAGTFSTECEIDMSPGDSSYSVELRTTDGGTATDTVLIRSEGCG